jgi:hypothetical protein
MIYFQHGDFFLLRLLKINLAEELFVGLVEKIHNEMTMKQKQ